MTEDTESRHDRPKTAAARHRRGVKYQSVHARLRRTRGPASSYRCAVCGQQAVDWSYSGTDPLEVAELPDPSPFPRRPRRYSLNPDHYAPLCLPCHHDRDRPTHCRNGHPLDGANGYQQRPSRPTRRECRACRRERVQRQRQCLVTPQQQPTDQETSR